MILTGSFASHTGKKGVLVHVYFRNDLGVHLLKHVFVLILV